jgi:hypothetical protein
MGIDIYAEWKGQSDEERHEQSSGWPSVDAGRYGRLREAYHGEPYATMLLCSEAFDEPERSARIPASVLQKRLPQALAMTEERYHTLYKSDYGDIERVKQSFREFVSLCERKEIETGEPVLITASF